MPVSLNKDGTERQRLRGVSFKKEYMSDSDAFQKMKGRGGVGRARQATMVKSEDSSLVAPQSAEDAGKITVVLDLDETLIYAREGPLYARPGLRELLKLLADHFEPIVWTAGVRAYAQAVLRNIDRDNVIRHCVYRHRKWYTGQAGYQKPLDALGRPLERMLIIENTPDCLRGFEENGVLVEDYEGGEKEDQTLPAIAALLQSMLEQIAANPEFTVAKCIENSKLLTRELCKTDLGDSIHCYCLNYSGQFADSKSLRVNRDLKKK
jgi:RNA polymerase II subunit A small phosphatase-like protein